MKEDSVREEFITRDKLLYLSLVIKYISLYITLKYIHIKITCCLSILVQEKISEGKIQNKTMVKMKFYGKSVTLLNTSKSVTFVFCRTDPKKKSF